MYRNQLLISFLLFIVVFNANAEYLVDYKLDGLTPDNTITDSTGQHSLKINGSISFEAGALEETDKAVVFNVNSWLDKAWEQSFNPTSSFSIDCWVKPLNTTGTQHIVSSRSQNSGYMLRSSNGTVMFYLGSGVGWNSISASKLPVNTWSHILATFESEIVKDAIHQGTARIFVNGNLKVSKTLFYTPNMTGAFKIGAGGDTNNTEFFKGSVDELRIFTGVNNVLTMNNYFNKSGYVTRRKFSNLEGSSTQSLINYSRYPFESDTDDLIFGSYSTPANTGDNYGVLIEAYFTPSQSGEYEFFLSSDDNGELYISQNESALNLVKICSVPGWSGYNQFDKFPSQKSSPISLQAGKTYLLRSIYKESVGGDHLNVKVKRNGGELLSINSGELRPVLFDVQTNLELLKDTLSIAKQKLDGALANSGITEQTYTIDILENFKYDIARCAPTSRRL